MLLVKPRNVKVKYEVKKCHAVVAEQQRRKRSKFLKYREIII